MYLGIQKNLLLIVVLTCVAGCATTPAVVRTGDRVTLGFTCRLPGGELAVTTRPASAVSGEPTSSVYLPRTGDEAVTIVASSSPVPYDPLTTPFETEVMNRISQALAGRVAGESYTVDLAPELRIGLADNEQRLRVARTRKRPVEQRYSRDDYQRLSGGRTPEVGARLMRDPLVPGTVTSLDDSQVVVAYAPVQSTVSHTPFGPATITRQGDAYEIRFDPPLGHLVRSGGLVGRVSALDQEFITIDYHQQFGGVPLRCDVRITSVASPQPSASPPHLSESPLPSVISEETESQSCHSCGDDHRIAVAAAGDLAMVDYDAYLGEALFHTTRRSVAENAAVPKVNWFAMPDHTGAEAVTVGKRGLFPGVGEALVGMKVGEKKRITLPPEQAFGPRDPGKEFRFPLSRTIPQIIGLSAEEYVARFGGFPVSGKEVSLTPYFSATVTNIGEQEVELTCQAVHNTTRQEPFGTTRITVERGEVTTTLEPVIGALFPLADGVGTVSAADGTTFTVDGNHPLAGKTIGVDIEMTGLTGKEQQMTASLPWRDDYDKALDDAKHQGKPVVLVLHAEWCSFCKKLFTETMGDPRITELAERVSWVRVDSDKNAILREQYGQKGFPMVVLFRKDGTPVFKREGYLEAAELRRLIEGAW